MTAGLAVTGRDMLVLGQLRNEYRDFDIGLAGGMYLAQRLTGAPPLLTAPTLGGLAAALDRTKHPVVNKARGRPERGPRDEMKRLREHWWPRYDIEFTGGAYIAKRFGFGHQLQPAGTLQEIDSLIRKDYAWWTSR